MPRKLAPTWVTRESASRFGLTIVQRAVLLCLWDHANGALEAWPSNTTIALETGCGLSSVKAATKVLHARGFIRRADGRSPFAPADKSTKVVVWIVEQSSAFVSQPGQLGHHVT